ncbi:MAG: dihydrofolate reductase family protein [Cytophagaceae bacterium]
MRKIVAAINMTVDGYADHTTINPDAEIHDHYTDLINSADTILYGRTTYQLMEYWRDFLENTSDQKDMNDFAKAIDKIVKVVFSKTLSSVDWKSAQLAKGNLKDVVELLKQQKGTDIFVGSPSLIVQLLELNLLDELQLCIHPVIVGEGLPLFKNITQRREFKLNKTKLFGSGAVVMYYEVVK